MTGSTLYEAVEQNALWNRLLTAIVSDFDGSQAHREVWRGHSILEYILMLRPGLRDGEVPAYQVPRTRRRNRDRSPPGHIQRNFGATCGTVSYQCKELLKN